jgi:hypothetical protein
MKKLLITAAFAGLASTAFAGAGDNGIPVVDGVTNGADAMSPFLDKVAAVSPILVLPALFVTPFVVGGSIVVDSAEKLTGN